MCLMNKIKNDQVESRKNKDGVKSSILTTLIGEASMIGKNDGNRETTDSEVVNVIKKFIKNIDETLKVKHEDTLLTEKQILESYLPKQLSDAELKVVVGEIIDKLGEKSPKMMGAVMKDLKASYDGLYDGKVASGVVKDMLR